MLQRESPQGRAFRVASVVCAGLVAAASLLLSQPSGVQAEGQCQTCYMGAGGGGSYGICEYVRVGFQNCSRGCVLYGGCCNCFPSPGGPPRPVSLPLDASGAMNSVFLIARGQELHGSSVSESDLPSEYTMWSEVNGQLSRTDSSLGKDHVVLRNCSGIRIASLYSAVAANATLRTLERMTV